MGCSFIELDFKGCCFKSVQPNSQLSANKTRHRARRDGACPDPVEAGRGGSVWTRHNICLRVRVLRWGGSHQTEQIPKRAACCCFSRMGSIPSGLHGSCVQSRARQELGRLRPRRGPRARAFARPRRGRERPLHRQGGPHRRQSRL